MEAVAAPRSRRRRRLKRQLKRRRRARGPRRKAKQGRRRLAVMQAAAAARRCRTRRAGWRSRRPRVAPTPHSRAATASCLGTSPGYWVPFGKSEVL
eukprot:3972514-Prymnesium_polylepis.1